MSSPILYVPRGDCLKYEKLTTATAVGFTSTLEEYEGRIAKAVLITVETADIRFTMDGTTPVISATSGGTGHLMVAGQSFVVDGHISIRNFLCINAVASSGAVVFCSFFY